MKTPSPFSIRAALPADMPAVLKIYNEEVLHSTSTYQYETRNLTDQLQLLEDKNQHGHGFLVAETIQGEIAGYANYGLFRPREGWRFTCEHSIYLDKNWRGKGIALNLLKTLMKHAKTQEFHSIENLTSSAVTSVPSLNFKPSRSVKVYTRPSSLIL